MGMSTETASHRGKRPPAVAGQFYPHHPEQLKQTIRTYIAAADVPALPSVRAVIAPHAGYQYSGPVAGYSYKALAGLPDVPYTVYLLGPAHRMPINGVGLSSAGFFETPLGTVPVATEPVARLMEQGAPYRVADAAHRPEHCLEVQLPFLQTVLQQFSIVPMLFDGQADPVQVGKDLARVVAEDAHTLIVVSSDLSHFHSYHEATRLDQAFLASVVAGDREAAQQGEACGLIPILTLMVVAEILKWKPHLLQYRNSGDTAGPRWEVVGYGAVAYCAT